MKTILAAGLVLLGMNGFAADPNVSPPKNATMIPDVPTNGVVKPDDYDQSRELYHKTQVQPQTLQHYSRMRADEQSMARARRAQHASWANVERIFRSDNDQIGNTDVRDTVVVIFPPGLDRDLTLFPSGSPVRPDLH